MKIIVMIIGILLLMLIIAKTKAFCNRKILNKISLCLALVIMCTILCSCQNNLMAKSKDLTTYKITASYDDEQYLLTANQSVDYINDSSTTLTNVCFHLHANAFSETALNKPVGLINEHKAYPNGKSYGGIEIKSVTNGNTQLQYEIEGEDNNILNVSFGKELFPDERFTIIIEYNVKLANINHRLGYGDNTINFGNFYPIVCVYENGEFFKKPYHKNGDPFYSKVSNYEVEISYPKQYVIAHTGEGKTVSFDNVKKTMASASVVRDFIFVLSNKFSQICTKVDDITINYFCYNDKQSDKSLETSALAVKTYNEKFGKYPYKVLNVVEANFVHGGMEYPNLVLISDELEDYSTYTNVIVHEIAHQWWYGVVGNNQYDYGWIDEGLTEFATAYFYEANNNYDRTYENVMSSALKNYGVFESVYTEVYGNVNTDMKRALNEFKTEPEYVYITYVKGMLLFDSVRKTVGDTKFFNALKKLFEEYKYNIVSPAELIGVFEKINGKNMESYFNSWINGDIVIVNN